MKKNNNSHEKKNVLHEIICKIIRNIFLTQILNAVYIVGAQELQRLVTVINRTSVTLTRGNRKKFSFRYHPLPPVAFLFLPTHAFDRPTPRRALLDMCLVIICGTRHSVATCGVRAVRLLTVSNGCARVDRSSGPCCPTRTPKAPKAIVTCAGDV